MTIATAKKKLLVAFSEFIRLRDSPDGYGSCISCGKLVSYPNSTGEWHCGHFFPRSVVYANLYFSEINSHGQCSSCNAFLEGNTEMYRRGLIKRYGQKILDDLELKRSMPMVKMYDFEFDELAKHYRKLNRETKKERGI